jgi:anti-anti-sigma regulatory factor
LSRTAQECSVGHVEASNRLRRFITRGVVYVATAPPRVVARRISDPPARVIGLSGEHDLSTVPGLERALAFADASGDPIVVDLRRATFADSAILGTIIKASKHAGRRGFAVVMPPPGEVAKLFDLVDARSVLVTFPTLRTAVEWCSPGLETAPRAIPAE